ncbi:MAG: hypothetical protein WAM79_21810 [Candidatus Sulfotelmatobacter sp.]
MPKTFLLFAAASLLLAAGAYAQDDSPSLGDLARQVRQQKQLKDPQTKDAAKSAPTGSPAQKSAAKPPAIQTPHVITNENIGSPAIVTSAPVPQAEAKDDSEDNQPDSPAERTEAAEKWKQQIQSQKQAITSLQRQIDEIGGSIQYAGGNCVANCVEWNERQKQKQDQVESMKAQLADQQKRLEDMQESARKQGFGSTVYDP